MIVEFIGVWNIVSLRKELRYLKQSSLANLEYQKSHGGKICEPFYFFEQQLFRLCDPSFLGMTKMGE